MHKIDNISFSVDMPLAGKSENWEKYFSQFVQNRFLPKVAAVLDAWDKQNPNLKCLINEIEIEVNTDELDLNALENQLLKQLNNWLFQASFQASSSPTYENKIQLVSEASIFEIVLYYIKTGIVSPVITLADIKAWIVSFKLFSEHEKKALLTVLSVDFVALKRFQDVFYDSEHVVVNQLLPPTSLLPSSFHISENVMQALLTDFCSFFNITIHKILIHTWCDMLSTASSFHRFTDTFIKIVKSQSITFRLKTKTEKQVEQLLVYALLQYHAVNKINISWQNIVSPTTSNSSGKTNSMLDDSSVVVKKAMQGDIARKKKNKKKELSPKQENTLPEKTPTIKDKNSIANKTETPADINDNQPVETNTDLVINTEKAGLILIHPFFKSFFSKQQLLTTEGTITNKEKMAAMLHYLATGNQKSLDLDLNLEKVWLSIPIQCFIETNNLLTKGDVNQCDALLKAVLKEWKVLQNSSLETLRDMFLKRDGIIKQDEKWINLKVEKLAQDILLEKLPWGIGIVKLPWQKKLINTNWL
jgi:hypothetical protein